MPDDANDAIGEEQVTATTAVRTAYISGNTFAARALQYVEVDGNAMFEGDIVLGPVDEVEQISESIKARLRGEVLESVVVTGEQFRWPNGTVSYDIDPDLPNQARVTDAIAHWEANTLFRFVLRTPANEASFPDWVTFRPGGGCSSSVGRRGGHQFINLGDSCGLGNTIHEIGHTIGFWHEQSREDRDAFVTINWANIQQGHEHNFNQQIADGDDVGPYDYGSIMHYARNAFGVGGAETITPVDPDARIGQRNGLSAGDIASANAMVPKARVETIKEQVAETVKEQSPETLKERIPETAKEQSPETIKERLAETVKERAPETAKERAPETTKENVETLVEGIGSRVEAVQPGLGGGRVPFALRTAHAGQADAGDLEVRLATIEEAMLVVNANQELLAEQLATLLAQLGVQ